MSETGGTDLQPTGVERQLHVALANMPGALVYTDANLNIVFCNDRFKEMYAVPRELLDPGRLYLTAAGTEFSAAGWRKAAPSP